MRYTCVNCKSDVQIDDQSSGAGVRCPYCGHRIWLKDRARDARAVTVQ